MPQKQQVQVENSSQVKALISATVLSDVSLSVHTASQSYRSVCDGDQNSATLASCFFNLCNTVVGSGMLGLPYAFAQTGWLLGTVLCLVCAFFSSFALHCLALCALERPPPSSFYSVAIDVVPSLTTLIDLAVAAKCFGVATSYLIVMGDLMPQVMEQLGGDAFSQQRELWVLVGFAIVAPLSCLHSLDSLKFTSFLSVGFVMFLTIIIVLYSSDVSELELDPCLGTGDDMCAGAVVPVKADMATLKILSIFIFGFTCQQNIFSVVNELQDPMPSRINIVIAAAIGIALAVYLIAAGCGYATFGSEVESDILVNYPETTLTSLARLMVSLLVAFSFPLQAHPARRCLMTLVAQVLDGPAPGPTPGPSSTSMFRPSDTDADTDFVTSIRSSPHAYSISNTHTAQDRVVCVRYWAVTICFLVLSLVIGLTVTDLGVVLSLVGATGSSVVSYILPGFLYYFMFKDKDQDTPRWKLALALFQGCLGVIIIPVCLYFIFA